MYICGIDASWAASGLAIVPEDDPKPWTNAKCFTIKTSSKKFKTEAERLNAIVDTILAKTSPFYPMSYHVEDFFGGFSVKKLGRLRGALDVEIWRVLGVEVQPINVNQARKLLLGPHKKLERKEAKRIVLATWQAAGAPVVDDAQADALTIANFALNLRGKPCLKK